MTVSQFERRFSSLTIQSARGGEYLRFSNRHGAFVASIELKHATSGPRIELFVLDPLEGPVVEYMHTSATAQAVIAALAKVLDRIWGQFGQYCDACKHVWGGGALVDTCPQCGSDDIDFLAF